jgi:3-dehydroquinate dehydratase type I
MLDSKNVTVRLCLSVTGKTPEDCIEVLSSNEVDLFEHRMDFMTRIERIDEIYDATSRPIIATCRPTRFGGLFDGNEGDKMSHLLEALSVGAQYIDLDLDTTKPVIDKLKQAVRRSGSALILSKHYWMNTPSSTSLKDTIKKMRRLEPDIIKIVTMASNRNDCLRILQLYGISTESGIPLIAFAMGHLGKFTRVSSLFLGAPFGYVSLNSEEKAAPGQITLSSMKSILEVLI